MNVAEDSGLLECDLDCLTESEGSAICQNIKNYLSNNTVSDPTRLDWFIIYFVMLSVTYTMQHTLVEYSINGQFDRM